MRVDGKYPERVPGRNNMEFLHNHRISKDFFGSLATVDGPEWWQHRSAVNAPMLKRKAAHPYLERQCHVADEFMTWIHRNRQSQNKVGEDFVELGNKYALEALSISLFNLRLGLFDQAH